MMNVSLLVAFHYENTTIHRTEIVTDIFAQSIDCGYTLEPPLRDGSNEYPQSIYILDQN